MFLPYLHSFRAIAILLIVAGHVANLSDPANAGPGYIAVDKLISYGTVLFVFIGGYLFEHLSADYRTGDYLWRKFRVVVVPYLICSIPAIAHAAFLRPDAEPHAFLVHWPVVARVAWLYLVGGPHLNLPLWYIPMIVVIYLAAPLLIQFVRHPRLYLLLPPLLLFSLFAHRPRLEYEAWQSLEFALYFAPVYVLGMWTSACRDRIEPFVDRHVAWLALVFLVYLAAEVTWSDHLGNYEGSGLFSREHGLLDWQLGQKLILCYLVLGMTRRWSDRLARPLHFIGVASFTIYFLHYYVLVGVMWSRHWVLLPPSLPYGIAVSALAVAVCCAIAWVARRLFGRHSRMLVGA